ncbi:MAG: hypothetical protein JNL72_02795 [Flavipsychrobacter sp.]|nr:hypothetical protein [Flavipsychrobacter sp.]
MTRPLPALVLLAAACFTYASCGCHKVKCSTPGISLRFEGFNPEEVDTLYDIRNGDTVLELTNLSDDAYVYHVSAQSDRYEGAITLWVPGADKTLTLGEFTYKKENCNKCYPVGYDKYDRYSGCTMNGTRYSSDPIPVYK